MGNGKSKKWREIDRMNNNDEIEQIKKKEEKKRERESQKSCWEMLG